jgi:hypothetical protein
MRTFLRALADELKPKEPKHEIVLVGGALLALHDLRQTTHDMDSITLLSTQLHEAIIAVANRHNLSPDWLNDRARSFTPATLSLDQCELIFESPSLNVFGAPFDQVFVMKLYRNDAQDFEDMITLWPLCSFDSPLVAVDAFIAVYPHAPRDEYLSSLITKIAEASSADGPPKRRNPEGRSF